MTFMYFTGMIVGAAGMFLFSKLQDKSKYLEGYKAGMQKRLLKKNSRSNPSIY